jgi:hypothetical protein
MPRSVRIRSSTGNAVMAIEMPMSRPLPGSRSPPAGPVGASSRTAPGESAGPRQNRGAGARSSTMAAASASLCTDGGEPSSGCRAVSFMQATATTPTRAAAIA